MPKPTKGPRMGGSPAHERIMMANLATQLFEHGRITTTEAKAKRLRPIAEKLITKARKGDLHSRRLAATTIKDKGVLHTLFATIGPSLADRDGGYIRITKVSPRKGDNAPMAVIEVITETVEESRANRKKAGKKVSEPKAAAPVAVEEPAEEKVADVESGTDPEPTPAVEAEDEGAPVVEEAAADTDVEDEEKSQK